MAPDEKYLTSAEVAARAQVTQSTVNRWANSGRLDPVYRLPGERGANVFRQADVEALLSSERAS